MLSLFGLSNRLLMSNTGLTEMAADGNDLKLNSVQGFYSWHESRE